MNEERYKELIRQAEQASEKADEHARLTKHYRDVASEFRQQAAELITPFSRGDVIEIERKARWRTPAKRYTIKVTSIHSFSTGSMEVRGFIVTKKGKLSTKTTYAFVGGNNEDQLVRVVERAALSQPGDVA
jgi:hypothetical protein